MKRILIAVLVAGALLGAVAPAPTSAGYPPSEAPIKGKWERLAPDRDAPARENSLHEVRVFRRTADEWVSTYKFQHDPFLGTSTPARISETLGEFRGVEVDVSTVDCGSGVCPADMTFALSGHSTFLRLADDPVILPTDFVTTESGMAWWIAVFDFSPFAIVRTSCPWYRDFDAALAANPDFAYDCVLAVDDPIGGPIDVLILPEEKNCADTYDNDGDGHIDGADSDCTP